MKEKIKEAILVIFFSPVLLLHVLAAILMYVLSITVWVFVFPFIKNRVSLLKRYFTEFKKELFRIF